MTQKYVICWVDIHDSVVLFMTNDALEEQLQASAGNREWIYISISTAGSTFTCTYRTAGLGLLNRKFWANAALMSNLTVHTDPTGPLIRISTRITCLMMFLTQLLLDRPLGMIDTQVLFIKFWQYTLFLRLLKRCLLHSVACVTCAYKNIDMVFYTK
ncbi:hypothetical protein BCR41DRAFT_408015 [Lobosporangium transversale]|uniref:Uncharacterized protein n=1 Tax=Lobosporangium transversale TaxID=64571 RepID=A0A1Y2GM26_9FUNG|nr:hypothetical protein BCR41DRAFT_408015 [Lobosporangium transversale]ORZ12995.1 hypothetical protein BCR41DRAFT_408015 [Lobosporangium transversale]|eukprot:XP_021880344.1 hypothetical protein BCR41DRAFT_408015 [Lobosporangium transversale]